MQGGKIFSTSLEEEEEKEEKEEEKNCSTTYLTEVPGLERGILTHANKSEGTNPACSTLLLFL